MKLPTTRIIIRKSEQKQNGLYPIKLRVTFNRKYREYTLPQYNELSLSDFDKVFSKRPGKLKPILNYYNSQIERADEIISGMGIEQFMFNNFKQAWIIERKDLGLVEFEFKFKFAELEKKINLASDSRRKSSIKKTLQGYKETWSNFSKFKSNASVGEIDKEVLEKYELDMRSKGNSNSTISKRMRDLRHVLNISKEAGRIQESPFGRTSAKYQIPRWDDRKESLTYEEIKKLQTNEFEEFSPKHYAASMWLLLYYCNGCNWKDAILFERDHVESNVLFFNRAKTANKVKKEIKFYLSDEIKGILSVYGAKKGKYLLPIIDGKMNYKEIEQKLHSSRKYVNRVLGEVAEDLEIFGELKLGTARHSFANRLKESGVSEQEIGDAMGHQDTRTTEIYFSNSRTVDLDSLKNRFDKLK